ncbi:hypothetical protein [Ectothiorhodospira sp. BSL-9]|uniref:hypothetical protein n=1 Tax=Ectothiorhodospira sp. BSL-9 TaxID=1442136 RepID=UPI0007B4596A|nr:hypothetical protein [Ectothiorhodospira sp. BSL-9]ANB01019.1 hypothetical protein ECTOBSL9_0028 [Ectothiorhodospira sp. BSL-9]TVQ74112.1 MAG: hypothetical protein EA372_03485 [Chromatiaceae bacterium]
MYRLGKISMLVGTLVCLISLITGFTALFTGYDELAKYFLSLVPISFLLVFTGLVTVVLTGPRD